ncbi:immunity 49 family protein [Nocardiopsis deserti]|uniref:immunity 49 family protein n=1 Tax=Nocardiopsis deserti TaxID=2605988 RepID=UPI00123B8DED|nr:immunity 49 family protein [Nocardiopsis deserti]
MTFHIERHDISNPNYPQFIAKVPERRKFYVQWLIDSPFDAGGPLSGVKDQAELCLSMDTDVDRLETWEAWVTYMQMSEATLAVSTTEPGTQFTRMINHQEHILTAVEPDYFTNASNWLTAFYLAVTCRDQERYRSLCQIPVETLRQAGESLGSQYNPYIYHLVEALQAFVLNRPGLGENLLKAMELSDPANAEIGTTEVLNKLTFPPLNTLMHLVRRNSDKFNEALAEGLELFRSFRTANEERAKSIEGGTSIPLLALACLAYDTAGQDPDFHFDVESGYLPKHILQRSWHGEFPI